jgi:sRNA-binding regulator protein Hfq
MAIENSGDRPFERKSKDARRQLAEQGDGDCTRRLEGKDVFITFLDGKSFAGRLSAYSRYSLVVTRNDTDFHIYKHAIRYLRQAKEGEI